MLSCIISGPHSVMAEVSSLSLFGENHQNHDSTWTLHGIRPQSLLCIACMAESFENQDELVIKKKYFLGELLGLLSSSSRTEIWKLLEDDEEVLEHLLRTIFNLLGVSDDDVTTVSSEKRVLYFPPINTVLVLICCQLKSDDLVYFIIQEIIAKIESGCGYQQSLPYLSLIGQLLQVIPVLASTLAQHGDSLLDYLVSGLASSSEDVKTSIVFLLARLLGPLHDNDIYPQLSMQIAHAILPILSAAQSVQLQTNAIGLLRRLLESKELTNLLMKPSTQPSISSVIKKILLNRNDILQISCVQCISQIVVQDALQEGDNGSSHTRTLLDEDVAEFLFEALSTTNDLLLSSIFCCLLLLSKHETFFTKCHTVYGIEAIVRTLQHCQKISSTDTLTQGLQLLSDILHRQPKDVKLLTSLTISRHICDVLAHCIRHQDTGVCTQATKAFAYLLRRDHLPSPIDFKSLAVPLDGTLALIQRLPRPTCSKRAGQNPGRETRRTGGKFSGDSQGAAVAKKQQDVLELVMSVLLNGLRLVQVCQEDPTSDPGVFLKPKTTITSSLNQLHPKCPDRSSPVDNASLCENNLSSFLLYLMESLDSVCIPAVMANHEGLSQAGIYTALFDSLSIMLSLHKPEDQDNLYEKLVGSSFIQLALEVRHRYQSQEGIKELKNATDTFLVDLLHCFSSSDKSGLDVNISTDVVHGITGSPIEMCHHLLEDHGDTLSRLSGSALHTDTQQCLLALLYYAWLYGDRWLPSLDLLNCLTSFITQHPDMTTLPLSSSKHLLFLFADCFVRAGSSTGSSACYILADHMTRLNVHALYTNHRSLVQWVFTAPNIPTHAMQKVFAEWIDQLAMDADQMNPEDHERDGDIVFTLHLMGNHPSCLDVIMDMLQQAPFPTSPKCACLIKHLLSTTQPIDDCLDMDRVKKRMPDLIQACTLMTDPSRQTGTELGCILDVLCLLYRNHPSIALDETDLKIIYHVINILTKQTDRDQDAALSSLNFLTNLLVHTARHGESRVLSLIISNGDILTCIQSQCSLEPTSSHHLRMQCCALTLLAHLTVYQKQYKMKVNQRVTLKEDILLRLMSCSSKEIQQLASIQLWTALFLSSTSPRQPPQPPPPLPSSSSGSYTEPSLVKVQSDRRRRLLEEEDLGLPVTCHTLRRVYAFLQNSMLQGSELFLHASIICIKAMIDMTADKNPTANQHLLSQPWNQQLINCGVELYQETNTVNQAIPELITLFLMHGNVQGYVKQHHVDSLLVSIFKTEPTQHDRQRASSIQQLLNTVLSRPELMLSKRQSDQLASWMDKLKTHIVLLPQDCPTFHLLYP